MAPRVEEGKVYPGEFGKVTGLTDLWRKILRHWV